MVVAQAGLRDGQVFQLGEVRRQNVDLHAGFFSQVGSQGLHPRFVAGDQHQIVTPPGEAMSVGRADATGSAGDENGRFSGHLNVFSM